jgi:putative ABC transport system permease protein
MKTLLLDLRYALRSLRRTPGFTLVALAILALGIGFNSANFSLMQAVLLRPVALPELDRLAAVQEGPGERAVSAPAWRAWRAEARSFEGLAAGQFREASLSGAGVPEHVIGYQVSPEFFPVMRTPPALGRTLSASDRGTVVLADGLWRRRFGGDPRVIGSVVKLDGVSHLVVGVMPRSFRYPAGVEVWTPLALTPEQGTDRERRDLWVVGRLRPGVGLGQANAELRTIAARQLRRAREPDRVRPGWAVPLARTMTDDASRAFVTMLVVAPAFVLLIVCGNLANLLLARGSARRRELAVRAALGAGRRRLIQLLLAESLLLALGGALLSLLVAFWGTDAIKAALPAALTRFIPRWDDVGVDPAVLLFTLTLAVVTALLFGLGPSLRTSRVPIAEVLKDGGQAVAGGGKQRLRSVLVALQLALALVLLVGTAATARGFVRAADPRQGIDPAGVLRLRVSLPEAAPRYAGPAEVLQFQRRALAELRAVPGVTDAAAASNIPWGDWGESRSVRIDAQSGVMDFRAVSPGYLGLLRVPTRAGAPLTAADDRPDAEPVALVSESAARRFWPEGNAVGAHLTMNGRRWRVAGVVGDLVGDVQRRSLRQPFPTLYVPYGVVTGTLSVMYIVIRTTGDPAALAGAVREAMARVDGDLAVTEVQTFAQRIDERLAGVRLGAQMMAVFAAMALLLAGLGVYGVTSYLVAQRQREIAVRMALGAHPRQVVRQLLKRGARLIVIGLGIGVPLAAAMTRAMSATLLDLVEPGLSLIAPFAAAVAALALLATFLPARRATRVDPVQALRGD